jgi:Fe2+ transport system protein FeoA
MPKLSDCHQGDIVKIVKIKGAGPFKRRLMEMGFLKGVAIKIVKYAPLKDPIELVIKGFHVSLRVEEANDIEVELAD